MFYKHTYNDIKNKSMFPTKSQTLKYIGEVYSQNSKPIWNTEKREVSV